jgi:bifunctional N-acetylglucosamine-1-phosphate-uridyltransferase/glucosamine-1-phosphate-acetyltransferase GlmU-like protein
MYIGSRTIVEFGVVLLGDTHIGENCYIEAGARLKNIRCDRFCHFLARTNLADTTFGHSCKIGAEMKRCSIGNNVKAVHSNTYLGDTTVSDGVNIAAGVITANYDGRDKKRTFIGQDSFIGVNVVLVAKHPELTIGHDVFVPAGLVVREDVPPDIFLKPDAREKLGYTMVPNQMEKMGGSWVRKGP